MSRCERLSEIVFNIITSLSCSICQLLIKQELDDHSPDGVERYHAMLVSVGWIIDHVVDRRVSQGVHHGNNEP
ncbi:hypothetical protein SBF1_40002 [Candidatus Desulfosporosinus infrequens]|uniref:Uncharacterized protein n=1 Tax=Candidatus Desulfosporosinus infrequens TaxID=2043169 RepID=A0A2U3L7U1_9FIRM|nr:hypothetical protein SBF1_40002 [Candidatus Desulfosporosinus infrequens]